MTPPEALDPEEALICTMVLAAAADGSLTDREIGAMAGLAQILPIFRDFSTDRLRKATGTAVALLAEADGLAHAARLIQRALDPPLRETAYTLACEVIAADHSAAQVELDMLEFVRDKLAIDPLIASALERGARAPAPGPRSARRTGAHARLTGRHCIPAHAISHARTVSRDPSMRPIIGILSCAKTIDDHLFTATPARYGKALIAAADALPLLIPSEGEAMAAVLDRLDGVLLPGSPSNVAPERYGAACDLTPGKHDPARDATMLPLIHAALARGLPLLAICRGIQELNVALGGTLHQKVQDLPGRLDHRGGPGPQSVRYGPKHTVALNGALAALIGRREITVNSLHEQAIDRPAERLAIEAVAPDGTIEAVRVIGSRSFAFGIQWHPEWDVLSYPDRSTLFAAFGSAARAFHVGLLRAA